MRTIHMTAAAVALAVVGALLPTAAYAAPAAPTTPAQESSSHASHASHDDDTIEIDQSQVEEAAKRTDGLAAASTPSDHTVNVAVVRVGGQTVPYMTDAEIDTELAALSAYWVDNTGGAITSIKRSGEVARFVTLSSCSEVSGAIWTDAAAKFGNTQSSYYRATSHLLVIGPINCGSPGLATVMSPNTSNGGLIWAQDTKPFVDILTHEFGHNIGLHHANSYNCTDPVNARDTRGTAQQCHTQPYGDSIDLMGPAWTISNTVSKIPNSINAHSRESLGVLKAGEQKNVSVSPGGASVSTTYTLLDAGMRDGLRSLKVTDPVSKKVYYVEFRKGGGSDRNSLFGMGLTKYASPRGHSGVRVLGTDGTETLNFTTQEAGTTSRQLHIPAGSTFTSDSGSVTITPKLVGNYSASISVAITAPVVDVLKKYSAFASYASAPKEILGKTSAGWVKLTAAEALKVPASSITKREAQFLQDPSKAYFKVVWETTTPISAKTWAAEGSPTPKQVTRAPEMEYYTYASAPKEVIVRTPLGVFRHQNAGEVIPAAKIVKRTGTYYIRSAGQTQVYKKSGGVTKPISDAVWRGEGKPTPMTPESMPVGSNPFASSSPYVNPNTPSAGAAASLRLEGNDADAAQLDKISANTGTIWVGDWDGL